MLSNVLRNSLILLLCSSFVAISVPDAKAAKLFNTSERRSTDISAFTKWTRMLKRHPSHLKKLSAKCHGNSRCKKQDWENMLAGLSSQSRHQQIKSVNRYMNRTPYIQDIVNWGMEDYWETLFEFFTRNGDCEDYAIAKYMSLKKLGFSENELRIVVLQDHNLGVVHSVLAVYDQGKIYILDNQIKSVLEDRRIHHYQPLYSINTQAWWRHLP